MSTVRGASAPTRSHQRPKIRPGQVDFSTYPTPTVTEPTPSSGGRKDGNSRCVHARPAAWSVLTSLALSVLRCACPNPTHICGSSASSRASRGTRTLSRGLLEQSPGEWAHLPVSPHPSPPLPADLHVLGDDLPISPHPSREQMGPRRGYPGPAVPLPGLHSPGTSSHTGRLPELRIGRVRRETAGDHLGATRLPGRDCGRSRLRLREIPAEIAGDPG